MRFSSRAIVRPFGTFSLRNLLLLLVCISSAFPYHLRTAEASKASPPKIREVVIVFKTHFDIGYTDMASNVVRRYQTTMIDQALQVVEQNRNLPPEQQFAWTIPGWPMKKITEDWPGQTPERKQKILQAFKDGRFVVHALPFTTHTEWLEPEDLVRGLGFAARLAREAGVPLPRDAKMTDVPCHSWIIPTLLRHAGVDFLHLGCNAASSSPRVPTLFWWEGPDGSRVLTMYSAAGYGTGLVPPSDWPYKTWLALIHTGDNHGPPTPDEVKKLLAEAAQKLPGIKVRIGRLSDFADGIIAEKADIPVVRGDMPDTWIHGPMCDPQGAKLARNIRPAITTAELLNTHLKLWGVPAPDVSSTIADAYEQSLLYGEHTWGGALYWVTKYGSGTKWGYGDTWKKDYEGGRFQRLEDSWAEHTSYIERAQQLTEPLLRTQMRTLAASVAQDGERIVVFNPLPWRLYQTAASVDVTGTSFARLSTGVLRCVDGGEGRLDPCFVSDGKTMRFTVDDVPPMGYRTFVLGNRLPEQWYFPESDEQKAELDTGLQKATLDLRRGSIRTLWMDNGRGAQHLVDATSDYGFGQVLYERFDSNNVAQYVKDYVKINADWAINELGKPSMPSASLVPYRASSPTNFTIRYTNSWHAAEAIMHAPASAEVPFGVTTRLILYNWLPFADLEVTVHDKPADPWPEAAWICLPLNVPSPQFRIGRQNSFMDPARDIVPGANRHLFAVDTGISVFGANGGVSLCPLDSPLISLDTPGCWKYSLDFVPRKPVVFINLFNNQWTTNFRLWNKGTWTSRVRIWQYSTPENMVRRSLEARYPLLAACVTGPKGNLPVSGSGLALQTVRFDQNGEPMTRPRALVTSFAPNPDGAWHAPAPLGNERPNHQLPDPAPACAQGETSSTGGSSRNRGGERNPSPNEHLLGAPASIRAGELRHSAVAFQFIGRVGFLAN